MIAMPAPRLESIRELRQGHLEVARRGDAQRRRRAGLAWRTRPSGPMRSVPTPHDPPRHHRQQPNMSGESRERQGWARPSHRPIPSDRGVECRTHRTCGVTAAVNRLRLRLKTESGKTKGRNRIREGRTERYRRERRSGGRSAGRTRFRKGAARDEAGTVLSTSRDRRQPVQRGGRADGHRIQAAMPGDDPPPGVEQVLRQSGRPVDGPGLRREGERQDGASAPGELRARRLQPDESGRAGLRHLVRRLQPLPGQLPDGDARPRHGPGPGRAGGSRTTWTRSCRWA